MLQKRLRDAIAVLALDKFSHFAEFLAEKKEEKTKRKQLKSKIRRKETQEEDIVPGKTVNCRALNSHLQHTSHTQEFQIAGMAEKAEKLGSFHGVKVTNLTLRTRHGKLAGVTAMLHIGGLVLESADGRIPSIAIPVEGVNVAIYVTAELRGASYLHFHLRDPINIGGSCNELRLQESLRGVSISLSHVHVQNYPHVCQSSPLGQFAFFYAQICESKGLPFETIFQKEAIHGSIMQDAVEFYFGTQFLLVMKGFTCYIFLAKDVGPVVFERAAFYTRSVDFSLCFQDLNKNPLRISNVPSSSCSSIKAKLSDRSIPHVTLPFNLDWSVVMKYIRQDIPAFEEDGGWKQMNSRSDEESSDDEWMAYDPEDGAGSDGIDDDDSGRVTKQKKMRNRKQIGKTFWKDLKKCRNSAVSSDNKGSILTQEAEVASQHDWRSDVTEVPALRSSAECSSTLNKSGNSKSEDCKEASTGSFEEKRFWTTLRHNGILFPPPYQPHGIPVRYEGIHISLTEEEEEIATCYAKHLSAGTDCVENVIFRSNFMKSWREVIERRGDTPAIVITDLSKVDFGLIQCHVQELKEKRISRSKKEKLEERVEKEDRSLPYKFATVDGEQVPLIGFSVDPPGLFRGRGDHPKAGTWKQRLTPSQVTINIGEGEHVPTPSAPYENEPWGHIICDESVQWIASWPENVNNCQKYVFFDRRVLSKKKHVVCSCGAICSFKLFSRLVY